jgi:integrase
MKSPKYCRQSRPGKPDLAYVVLKNGPRVYLGTYDSEESQHQYHRVLAEWHATGTTEARVSSDLTITELLDRYLAYAEKVYVAPSTECEKFGPILKPLLNFYGRTRASEFSPRNLKAVVQSMIDTGLSQSTINNRLGVLKRIFKWAVGEEFIPVTVHQALCAVEGLRQGRSKAPPPRHVLPVLAAHVDAIERLVSRQVWTLIQLELLTGARQGELAPLRPCDIDVTGKIWTSRPAEHKNAHRGHARVIYFGPRAQALLAPFLAGRTPWVTIFSPKEAEEERLAKRSAARVTPLAYGNRPGTHRAKKPKRVPGEHYDGGALRRAIQRACDLAGIPRWHPHQLRHAAATYLRKEFGLDGARVILGHRSAQVTDVYAELDHEKALDIMTQYG